MGLQRSRGNRFLRRLLDTTMAPRSCGRGQTSADSASPHQTVLHSSPILRQRSSTLCPDEGCTGDTVPSASVNQILRSSGQPMDAPVREFMESRFQQDFSGVRVHTGAQAAESAQALRARAYTVGNHIVFGQGEYAPSQDSGKRVLAHELTHTLQQSPASSGTGMADLKISHPSDVFEQEAEQVAERVMQGRAAGPVQAVGDGVARLQRQADPKYIPKMNCVTDAAPGTGEGTSLVGVSLKTLSKAHKDQIAAFYKDWASKEAKDFIAVEGYASSDGSKDETERQTWNWRYSCQRAELVGAELVRLGVPRSRIITFAHGETDQFSGPDSKDAGQNRRVILSTVQVGPKTPPPAPQNVSVPTKTEITTKTPGEIKEKGDTKQAEVEVKTTEQKQVTVEPVGEEEEERWFSLTYEFDLKQDWLKNPPPAPPPNAPKTPFLCDHGIMQVGGKVNVGIKLNKSGTVELLNEPELDFSLLPSVCGGNVGITLQANVLKLTLFKKLMEADLVGLFGLPDGWTTGLPDRPFTAGGQIKVQTDLHKLWAPLPDIKVGVVGGIGWQQGVLDPNNPGVGQPGTRVITVGGFLGADWDFGPAKKKPPKKEEE